MLLDLVGQQPPRVAWVCVQLARSRRVECGRTAACSRLDWPRCNALRDGVVSALPDGARAQPKGPGRRPDACTGGSALLLLQKAASWWLVAGRRAWTRAADESGVSAVVDRASPATRAPSNAPHDDRIPSYSILRGES